MSHLRLSAYRIMWLITFFDLPTDTERDRKNYNRFRKSLLRDGFTMMQYSVYIRHCASKESSQTHTKRIVNIIPPKGKISILEITDRQYGNIINFWGSESIQLKPPPPQLEMF